MIYSRAKLIKWTGRNASGGFQPSRLNSQSQGVIPSLNVWRKCHLSEITEMVNYRTATNDVIHHFQNAGLTLSLYLSEWSYLCASYMDHIWTSLQYYNFTVLEMLSMKLYYGLTCHLWNCTMAYKVNPDMSSHKVKGMRKVDIDIPFLSDPLPSRPNDSSWSCNNHLIWVITLYLLMTDVVLIQNGF